jgi:hypothetical protein
VQPGDAWDFYYKHQEKLGLLLLAAYSSQTTAPDLVPREMYGLPLRCAAGGAGQLGGDFSQQIFQLGGSILQEAVQTLCFDDATITDLKSSTGSGQ